MNVDDERLRPLAERLGARVEGPAGHQRRDPSSGRGGDRRRRTGCGRVYVGGERHRRACLHPPASRPATLACALAAALALGVDAPSAAAADRRRSERSRTARASLRAPRAALEVIDDTFNANPAGADAALELLAALAVERPSRAWSPRA